MKSIQLAMLVISLLLFPLNLINADDNCNADDALCWCKAKGSTGTFADVSSACRNYYECVSPTQAFYRPCSFGTAFNDATQKCDWPDSFQCGANNNNNNNTPGNTNPPPSMPTTSPSPPISDYYPCTVGNADCYCTYKGIPGRFADQSTGCASYYNCGATKSSYVSCQRGYLFSNVMKKCAKKNQVKCSTKKPPSTTPSTPTPTPTTPSSPNNNNNNNPPNTNTNTDNNKYKYVGYFQSWSDPWSSTADTSSLAKLPPYVNVVILSFMQPDTTYTGGMTFSGTGLQFSSDPSVIKDSIALLKQKNPNTKVLVAVGGATYSSNFKSLNAQGIASFVSAFGLDGVDIDYEPAAPNCRVSTPNGQIVCDTDKEYIATVKALRSALPRPAILSLAGWSIGAYGEGAYATALPQGQYTGFSLNMLRAVGDQLDLINIMSYDAGTDYSPQQALDAYQTYFTSNPNALTLGVSVPNEAWGGHVTSIDQVSSLCDYVQKRNAAGMMLWSLQKRADQPPSADVISQTVCVKLGLSKCTCPLSGCS